MCWLWLDTFLLDDTTSGSNRKVLSSHEVPRLSLDANQGDQKHVGGEHGLARPEAVSTLGVLPTHEVPRLSLDENLGDQTHVGGEHNLARTSTLLLSRSDLPSHPTQAKEAAPSGSARFSTSLKSLSHDKTGLGLGLSARMGLGLGGSKVAGELEEVTPPYVLLTDGSQFRITSVLNCVGFGEA